MKTPIDEPLLRFAVDGDQYRSIAIVDSHEQGLTLGRLEPGTYRVRARIESPNLRPAHYKISFSVLQRNFAHHLFFWYGGASIVVRRRAEQFFHAHPNPVMHFGATFLCEPMAQEVEQRKAASR